MKFFTALTLTLATLISIPSANAAIVTLAENTHATNEEKGDNTYSVNQGSPNWAAENFSLSGTYRILRISHVGQHALNVSPPTSIDWRIYSDSLSGPGSILASGNGVALIPIPSEGSPSVNTELSRYSIIITPVILGTGNYWIAFHNAGIASNLNWTFANGGTSFDGKSAVSGNDGINWALTAPDYAFRVEGEAVAVTPEPASFAIWGGIGLCGLFLSFRRRKRML